MIKRIIIVVCLACGAARADERILEFHADIDIAADRTVTVAETLRVRAEGRDIKRGIYRDFPTLYRDRLGNRVRVPFEVISVTRDGERERWHTESIPGGVRVYIGASDVFLDAGEYVYRLNYKTGRQVGFFDTYDELYWNVTGNAWIFPIDHASASVSLPEPVPEWELELYAYTGAAGDRGGAWRAAVTEPGTARFETTRVLHPGEGLTVVAGFPKGIVDAPSETEQRLAYMRDNLGVILGLVGLILVVLWYAFAWKRVGRDPMPGAIYPRYDPPEGYSPGMLRYIWKMGHDKTAMAAAMINMSVAGHLNLQRNGKTWVTEQGGGEPASKTEKALDRALFRGGDRLEFKQSEHSRVGGAVKAHKRALATRMETRYFRHNRLWWAPGLLLSLLSALAMVLLVPTDHPMIAPFLAVFLVIWNSFASVMVAAVFRNWRNADGVLTAIGALVLTLFTLPFVIAGLAVIGVFGWQVGVLPLVVLIGHVVVSVVFYQLMKAPTMRGREMLDAIEGLRLYLGVAERQDLEARHGGELPKTLAEFERLLPYAIALDCAETWAERFAEAIRAAELDGTVQSRSWYASGIADRGTFSAAGLGSSLAGGLAGSISSSSTAPGSSSGGGGGGFSGGGGGGGGGGGW